jgi:hypothetical protein
MMNEFNQKDDIYKDSPYKFIELNDGFRITRVNRDSVEIRLVNNGKALLFECSGKTQLFGLFQYYSLVRQITTFFIDDWINSGKTDNSTWIRRWLYINTAKSINKRVHVQWERMLTLADPTALRVQRAIFAASLSCAPLAIEDELYTDPWFIEDIVNYRAAAISTVFLTRLIHYHTDKRVFQIDNGINAADCMHPFNDIGTPPYDNGLEYLHHWQGLYSYNGRAYRSLNRTLMNLPGGIPMHLLWRLGFIELPRPITNRLELSLVLVYLRYEIRNPNWQLILYAQADQIKVALDHLSAHCRKNLSHRRWEDIQFLAMYLHDFPNNHVGNIVGLTQQSIDWHRNIEVIHVQNEIDGLGNTDAALPPIPLPSTAGITFLTNVEAINAEGKHMRNCIASFARSAVKGDCYLFHIDKDGEEACAQVNSYGQLIQVYGPHNIRNNASRWGATELYNWGKELANYLKRLNNTKPSEIDANS